MFAAGRADELLEEGDTDGAAIWRDGVARGRGLSWICPGIGDDQRYFQITAPIQLGNSGGLLIDMSGLLVGVVRAKLNALKV